MLVLTRKIQQSIVIRDDIKITVLEFNQDAVRIGIDAPKEVSVHRDEIYARIQAKDEKNKVEVI